ncbi:MAG: SGNH/GDSL hydrolase family protein [Clostridia bacterium]|nr:SGNH/GDSL hydrolase family protein [Clostridia bacterium]
MRFNRIFLFIFAIFLILFPLFGCRRASAAAKAVQYTESDFISELTFLGDSTTAHMQSRAAVQKEQVWATKNRYLNLDSRITYARIVAPDTGEEELIADVAARLKPRYLVITLGIDYGVYYYRERPDLFAHYYEKLVCAIQAASPETHVILQSIFPVGRSCTVITNDMVERSNQIIKELAEKKGLPFVDQTKVLADGQGYLREEFCYSEDGIHLTDSAYTAILSHLSTLEHEIRG